MLDTILLEPNGKCMFTDHGQSKKMSTFMIS